MTKRDNTRGGRNRSFKPDDFELWSKVAATVEPLKNRTAGKVVDDREPSGAPLDRESPRKPKKSAQPTQPKPAISRPPAPIRNHAPPLTGLDRRSSQKLARGNAIIDATLDLHGLGKESARTALKNFLVVSRASGRITVLIITGKGRSPYSSHTLHGYQQVDTPEREGVIRKAFPGWIDEPEMRAHVAGYQPAHPRHGGGGAFYVRLRKQKG